MPRFQNESGFTLLSSLLFLSMILFLVPILANMMKLTQYDSRYDELSVWHFFLFLQHETTEAAGYQVTGNTLHLQLRNGKTASYSRYYSDIRRQVNSVGHEIYLKDVKQIEFVPLTFGFKTIVHSIQGEIYEKVIIFHPK